MKIAVDLGHGVAYDGGAVGIIREEQVINEVGSNVIAKLRALGHSVLEVRPSSATSTSHALNQRTDKANSWGADLLVSIHANAGKGVGTEVFTYQGREMSQARNVLNNICALGFTNRGIKGDKLHITSASSMSAMLIEVCFIDTQSDVDKYKKIGSNAIADAIVKGLVGTTSSATGSNNSSLSAEVEKAKAFVGSRCKELQEKLIKCGYNVGATGADGIFGQATYNATVKFQKDNGLVADGLAGQATFAKLDEIIASKSYSKTQFIKDVQKALGATVDGIAGSETLSKTVTVSKSINNTHAVVKPIQKYLNWLGYETGAIDGIAGSQFHNAVVTYQRSKGCYADGELTRGGLTWKKLLGLA